MGTSWKPVASDPNPSPIVYVQTAVQGTSSDTGSMRISLYNILPSGDASVTAAASKFGFIPGTYTVSNTSGVAVTATSVCAQQNAAGACTSIILTWQFAPVVAGNASAALTQRIPFRVGLPSGTAFSSTGSISAGFVGEVIGGGPQPVTSSAVVLLNGGTYTGAPSCPGFAG